MSSIDTREQIEAAALLIQTQSAKEAAKAAAFAFAKLAERFRDAPLRSRNPSLLKRDVRGVLPADAGKLLCDSFDRGMLFFPSHDKIEWKGRSSYTYSEWDLRKRSLSYLRKLARDVVKDAIKHGDDREKIEADREKIEAAVKALEDPDVRSADPMEYTYVLTWYAFIRWYLAPREPQRFRSDWEDQFATEFDVLTTGRKVPHKSPFQLPQCDGPDAVLARLDISSDVQATACKILAEELQEQVESCERRLEGILKREALLDDEFESADDRVRGVSLLDAAMILSGDDEKAAKKAKKRWQNDLEYQIVKGKEIGHCPNHRQTKLYEPSGILEMVEKIEGKDVCRNHDLSKRLAEMARAPREEPLEKQTV